MGYRSEVIVMTTLEGFEKMLEIADETKEQFNLTAEDMLFPELGEDPELFFPMYHVYDNDKLSDEIVHFGFDWIKWYVGNDTTHFGEVLNKANDLGIDWQFLRLGEELGDAEHDYSDNFWHSELSACAMYVSQQIDFSVTM